MDTQYSPLDIPEVSGFLFHPRRESIHAVQNERAACRDVLIPVGDSVHLGGRLHLFHPSYANLLFFHGNGEIVADYDDMAPVYQRIGVNFCPVDYRGYGRSTGTPSCSTLIRDAHSILDFLTTWLNEKGYKGPVVVMGRSLGSAPAIELAAWSPHRIHGLIVESGFAYTIPLLRSLGLDVERFGLNEAIALGNHIKIGKFRKPTLIIHAELDRIIPFTDALALYDASAAADKWLVKIPEAGHNDIFYHGLTQYMAAMKSFMDKIGNRPG
jgi:hypothetical protein